MSGHGSVVEQDLAKIQTGVRFSLPALLRDFKTTFRGVQKSVDTGDKGQETFALVREIVNK
jgi:hypothetical protein